MTHIMTAEGWKPLYDTALIWAERERQLAAARADLQTLREMQPHMQTEMERQSHHHALMQAHATCAKAEAAYIGAR